MALEIACGVARNKFPHLTKVIGIAIDAPKDKPTNSEDFILMDTEWSDERRQTYEDLNKELKFFETQDLKTAHEIGRNKPCLCGSGKKFKRCHGSTY
jgi:uncharacterized protein YchJ